MLSQTMTRGRSLVAAAASVFLLSLGMAACGKKAAPPPPPPAPPAAAPAPAPNVTLEASPSDIQSGQSSTLSWTSENAVKVELDGSTVNLNGSQPVSPTDSTSYQIIATSADGRTATAAARITVTQPPPPPPPPPATADIGTFEEKVRDAFFDYDKSDIRPDAQMTLQADADFLKSHPDISVQIVGHCDARGSAEYNLALGSRRAESVKQFLVSQGVDASRITASSVGKEQPFCTQTSEDCYQQNRRGHMVKGGQ